MSQAMWSSLWAFWNWWAIGERPEASSPRPWMKIIAAECFVSSGGVWAGMCIGGSRVVMMIVVGIF